MAPRRRVATATAWGRDCRFFFYGFNTLPRRCKGWRGRGHCREVIGGSAMPHHATPNRFLFASFDARRAFQHAVKGPWQPRPSLVISPRSFASCLPTISLARAPPTAKHAGVVLRTTRPSKSSGPRGKQRVRAGKSERCEPDGCRGRRNRRHGQERIFGKCPRGTPEPSSTTNAWR